MQTAMNRELASVLGMALIEPDQPNINPADLDEFGEYKDQPRPEVVFELEEKETSVPDLQLTDAKVDYQYARRMNYTLLTMTTQALARALMVAKETDHPRAFESFNSLATTARGLTQDLLNLQKVFKEVTKGRVELEPAPPAPVTPTNPSGAPQASSGTTQDVMQLLQESIKNGSIKPIGMNDGGDDIDEDE